jgi:hypothetical protein
MRVGNWGNGNSSSRKGGAGLDVPRWRGDDAGLVRRIPNGVLRRRARGRRAPGVDADDRWLGEGGRCRCQHLWCRWCWYRGHRGFLHRWHNTCRAGAGAGDAEADACPGEGSRDARAGGVVGPCAGAGKPGGGDREACRGVEKPGGGIRVAKEPCPVVEIGKVAALGVPAVGKGTCRGRQRLENRVHG